MRYGIQQITSLKQYTICGPWVYGYSFTKYMVFPHGGERVEQNYGNLWSLNWRHLKILVFEGLCLLIHKDLCIVNCIAVDVISTLTLKM